MSTTLFSIPQINRLPGEAFVGVIGPVFESSPWIAEAVWPQRPFTNLDHLHRALCDVVTQADEVRQIHLIQAHPDLVGSAARLGTLTPESRDEQASAGLDRLNPEEVKAFQEYNRQYRSKFGFPFVICARLNKKESILAGFKERLGRSRAEEIKTALGEIFQIARLRLESFIGP
jgi:OHCU decarboxylase